MRIFLCLIAIVASACASLQRFRTTTAPAATPPQRAARPVPYPVFETRGFTRAVQAGTRTRTGEPGPNYWQQYAHYRIDAELVPATSQLNGRETVRYYNRSPDTLRTIWIHLNQNLFAAGAPRSDATPVTAGTEVLRVAAGGQALAKRDTGTGFSIKSTLLRVGPPRALPPNDSLDLDIAWAFQVPPDGAPR